MAEQSQEELLAEQKKNCIFCKIASGAISSKKVYEDDKFVAFLDINPVVPGHTILLPKEHIPILAIMPEALQREMFELGAKLAKAIQDAMISQRMTIVCQSGYAAGQRPPFHVMIHLLPREKGDGLEKFDLEKQDIVQSDMMDLAEIFSETTKQVLHHVGREDLLGEKKEVPSENPVVKQPSEQKTIEADDGVNDKNPASKDESHDADVSDDSSDSKHDENNSEPESKVVEFNSTSDALAQVLAMSPDLRNFIIHQPSLVQDYVAKSPKLKKLFEGVDINALSAVLRAQESAARDDQKIGAKNPEGNSQELPQARSASAQKTAKLMTDEELFRFIDGNEGLRTWVLENPEELSNSISKNPKLQSFFEGIDILALAKKYRGYLLKRGGV